MYLVVHPAGKKIKALAVSADKTTVEVIDTMTLSKKKFNSVTIKSIRHKVAKKKVKGFILRKSSSQSAKVVLVQLNTKGEKNIFLKKTAQSIKGVRSNKRLTIRKKQSTFYPVRIKTTHGVVVLHLYPTQWKLSF